MKIVLKFHVYLLYFPKKNRQRALPVGPGRFIVLNDSASPKMIIKMYLIFFKVLKLFECRRGDPYMTANKNFVRFSLVILGSVKMAYTVNRN